MTGTGIWLVSFILIMSSCIVWRLTIWIKPWLRILLGFDRKDNYGSDFAGLTICDIEPILLSATKYQHPE